MTSHVFTRRSCNSGLIIIIYLLMFSDNYTSFRYVIYVFLFPSTSFSITSLVVRAEEQRLHLDGLADGGHAVARGRWRSDDGVRHSLSSGGVLHEVAGAYAPCGAVCRNWRRVFALPVGLVVCIKGAVGGGQGGTLALGADHSSGPLQAERLKFLTWTVGEAVWDLGLWPDLGDRGGQSQDHIHRNGFLGPKMDDKKWCF